MGNAVDRIRTFIAIDLPGGIKDGITGYIRDISGGKHDYKWVAKDNLHITMAFLGDIEYDDLSKINSAIERAVAEIPVFSARTGSVGTFPSVIWIGLSQGEDECRGIFTQLTNELLDADFRLDDKRYHPHITIARSRRRMDQAERKRFEANEPRVGGKFKVKELVLFESQLRPQGPEYIPLKKIPLMG